MFLETINHLCFEAASRFLHQPRLTRAIDLIIYLSKLVSQGRTKATRHVGNPRDEFVLMTFRIPATVVEIKQISETAESKPGIT